MEDQKFKILLVDDEPDILEFIGYNLKKEGHEVETAINGAEAIKFLKDNQVDLIILDVMMPVMDGIETCEEIRKIDHCKSSIITFLTARNEDYSQIAGLEAGADDYITKPVRPKVLVSKVNALLRRSRVAVSETPTKNELVSGHGIRIDREKYQVYKDDEVIELPRKEFELLALLLGKPGKVFEREVILEQVWGTDVIVGDRTIDVHIRKLREKLGDTYFKTVKGVGYKFEAN